MVGELYNCEFNTVDIKVLTFDSYFLSLEKNLHLFRVYNKRFRGKKER